MDKFLCLILSQISTQKKQFQHNIYILQLEQAPTKSKMVYYSTKHQVFITLRSKKSDPSDQNRRKSDPTLSIFMWLA